MDLSEKINAVASSYRTPTEMKAGENIEASRRKLSPTVGERATDVYSKIKETSSPYIQRATAYVKERSSQIADDMRERPAKKRGRRKSTGSVDYGYDDEPRRRKRGRKKPKRTPINYNIAPPMVDPFGTGNMGFNPFGSQSPGRRSRGPAPMSTDFMMPGHIPKHMRHLF